MDLRGKRIEEGYTNLVTVEGDSVANSGKLQNGQGTDLTNVEVTGSVTASSFIGDGSALTGITVANQSLDTTDDVNFNSVTAVGTVAANAFTGDGSSLTGVTKANQSLDTTSDVDFNSVTAVGTITANAFSGDGSGLTGIESGATAQERVAIMDLMMRQAEDDFDNSRTEIDFYGGHYDVFVNLDKIDTALANIVSESNESPFYSVHGISFAKNGEKFYYNRNFGDGRYIVNSFNLSTAYDLSTATSAGSEVDFEGDVNTLYGYSDGNYLENLTIVDDGTHGLFMNENNNHVVSFEMSTPYDLSTKTNFKKNTNTTMFGGGNPTGVTMSDDGNYLYSHRGGAIRRHPMSTAYDISTASTTDKSAGISASGGIAISNDGTGLIAESGNGYNVYKLSTAWDVSTMTLVGSDTSVVQRSYDVDINDNHKQFFVNDDINSIVNQRTVLIAYNPSATADTRTGGTDTTNVGAGGYVKIVATVPLNQSTYTSVNVPQPPSFNMNSFYNWCGGKFSNNGDYIYMTDREYIYKYPLSTAFDPSTMQSSGIQSIRLQTTSYEFSQIIERPNGSLIVMSKNASFGVYEINSLLGDGSADLSAGVSLNYTMSSLTWEQNSAEQPMCFMDDGNKLLTRYSNNMYVYNLSTPYQFSSGYTVTLSHAFTGGAWNQDYAALMNNIGTKLYWSQGQNLYEYTLTTPYGTSSDAPASGNSIANNSGASYLYWGGYLRGNLIEWIERNPFDGSGTLHRHDLSSTNSSGSFQTTFDISDAITTSPSAVVATCDLANAVDDISFVISDGTNSVTVTKAQLDTEVDCSTLTSTSLTAVVELEALASVDLKLFSYALYFK